MDAMVEHNPIFRWISRFQSTLSTTFENLSNAVDEMEERHRVRSPSPRRVYQGENAICTVPDDIMVSIVFEYLAPNEVCRFGLTNRYYYGMVLNDANSVAMRSFWSSQVQKLKDGAALNCGEMNRLRYLENLLDLANKEIKHWSMISRVDSALQRFSKLICRDHIKPVHDRTIIGIVSNIGKFPTQEIAKAVGARRQYAMTSCLVRDMNSAVRFRQSDCNVPEGISFIPIQGPTVAAGLLTSEENELELRRYAQYRREMRGFIGRAIDLVELEPDYEFLRHGVLKSMIYRNITVWKNKECFATEILRAKDRVEAALASGDASFENIDANLFLNPVFVEDSQIITNPDEEDDAATVVATSSSPCLVSTNAIAGTVIDRPDSRNPGYSAQMHLEKLERIRNALLTSIAWIHYR